MKIFDKIKSLFISKSIEVETNRKEFMTRFFSLIMTAMTLLLTTVFLIGFIIKKIPFDSLLLSFIIFIFFLIGFLLSRTKLWIFIRFFLVMIIFITALYGNLIGGPGAPALVIYMLAIILSATLVNEKFQFIVMIISLLSYVLIYFLSLNDQIIFLRNFKETYYNRIIIVSATYVAASFLLWFLVKQFYFSLYKLDNYSKQLLKQKQEILDINSRLQKEIQEREILQKEKDKMQKDFFHLQKLEITGNIANGIAHDFKNYLHGIIGFSEIALSELDNKNSAYNYLNEIQQTASKASLLAKQLMEFGKKKIIKQELIDLNNLFDNVKNLLKTLLNKKNNLVLNVEKNLYNIRADYGQIEQIIINLLINARDATIDGGDIYVDVENIKSDIFYDENIVNNAEIEKESDCILITVRDTGTGMTDEVKNHLFDPFFTTKESGKGTGLGLASVKMLLEHNNGKLFFESELNVGTTFKIIFQRAFDDNAVINIRSEELNNSMQIKRILIIENEESLRNMLKNILSVNKYSVSVANNFLEAKEIISNNKFEFSLIITDTISNSKTIQNYNFSTNNFIFMYEMDEDIEHILNDDFFASSKFLRKPFTMGELLSRVEEF